MKPQKRIRRVLMYFLISCLGLLMIYPLIWLFFATFKTNNEIFSGASLLPTTYTFDAYRVGWQSGGQYTYTRFFGNTFELVIPTVALTLLSCPIVAYGFARFQFVGKKPLFALMIATLMLPNAVIIIPRYLLFRNLGWLNTYLPFWIPAMFACYPFFIFMLVQFFRGIPTELDESALLDGCNSFGIYLRIHLPLLTPALISVCIFQWMWTWNDFYNALIYVSSVRKYPLSLALRMGLDVGAVANWNAVLAMSLVSILPIVCIFFCLQKYFVEGIATTGFK